MKQSRAFFNIKTQFDNAGDALIIRELIRLASERAQVEVYLGRAPSSFRAMLDVNKMPTATAHENGGFFSIILAMLMARVKGEDVHYLLIPGGLNGERSLKQTLSGLISLLIFCLLKLARIKVSQVGISLERIGKRHAILLRLRSKLIYATAVRDRFSESYGKDTLKLNLTGRIPDLALNLFRENPLVKQNGPGKIAFSFRTDKDPSAAEKIERLAMLVAQNTPSDVQLCFIAQVGRDLEFMSTLQSKVDKAYPNRSCVLDVSNSIYDAQTEYSSVSVLFSNRLHALLLGLKSGARPAAFINSALDIKIRGVFEDAGITGQIFDINDPASVDIKDALDGSFSFDGKDRADALAHFFDQLIAPANGPQKG
jgi:polysaccharide pyruvyl transferase WcaK-like protein